ncbi:MAG: ABC transporter ATP-binding protein [Chloroflexi bacterium]|nr:ABC transporter ATP-binding protein [Chloroflexota bacterium]
MLEVKGIHTYYGNIQALRGVSLKVNRGEIVTLIGSNGAGKTTTLNTISGILQPREGEVWLQGERIDHLPPHEIVKKGISQAPEGRKIFSRLTVQENLEMGAYTRKDSDGIREDMERVFQIFPRLRERRRQIGGTLSGGEQQMLAIGRALMARPRVLLLDEPSMGLAPLLVEEIFSVIQEINQQGTSILLVEQNARLALSIAHRGYVLETGSIVLEGPADDLLHNPQVIEAYLGGH